MAVDWTPLAGYIEAGQRFLLTSHVKPDCDALGSELALAEILAARGKEAQIVNADEVPPHLAFLDPDKQITLLGRDISPPQLDAFDVLVILDTSAWDQLGAMAEVVRSTAAQVLIVDHHVSQDDMGGHVFKDVEAPATGVLVFQIADALGAQLTPSLATALFAAIATDTGWFRFPSTSAGTYRLAAQLIEAGAVPSRLFRDLYEQDTLARVLLGGRILSRVTTELDGRLAYAVARREDFEATDARGSDTENLIQRLLSIVGTDVALLFVEQPDGGCKVSFRSRGDVDVRRIAETFGGGGHKAASGARAEAPLADAVERVLASVRKEMS